MENEGIKYHPDVVILGFSINDLIDNIKADFFKIDNDGELVIHKKTYMPGVKVQNLIYSIPLMEWISQNSYFYSYSFNRAWIWFRRQFIKKVESRVVDMVSTKEDLSDYKIALTSELIKRMCAFCQKHQIKLIIIDILTSDGFNELKPAVSPELQPLMRAYSDAFIEAQALLSPYVGSVQLNVNYHITEFTHIMFALEAGRNIIAWQRSSHGN